MLIHYVTTTLRRLLRQPGYTALNVGGLAVGLATCLVIGLFLHHEWSYDRFHPSAEQVMRVLVADTTEGTVDASLPAGLPLRLHEAIPEVEAAVALDNVQEVLVTAGGMTDYETNGVRASPELFAVLGGFTVLHGNAATALDQPGSVVLTRPMAEKYFGRSNPVGQVLTTRDEKRIDAAAWRERNAYSVKTLERTAYTVTAVVEAPPSNSTVAFDFVLARPTDGLDIWNMRGTTGYLRLQDGVRPEALGAKLDAVLAQYDRGWTQNATLRLQPLTDVHLNPSVGQGVRTGPAQYLMMFALAALMVLGIACVNYMNLATARAADRSREVGVRKSMGAGRGDIARQFLGEALVFTGLAVGASLILTLAALPLFGRILGVDLTLAPLATPEAWAALAIGTGLVAAVAGGYPAFVLAQFEPARVLKGRDRPAGRHVTLRRVLVVGQFAASVVLILATGIVYQQMEFVRAERLNAQGEEMLVVSNRSEALDGRYAAFKEQLRAAPSVAQVTTGQVPGRIRYRTSTHIDTTGQFGMLGLLWVGDDYLTTLGLDVVAGQSFDDAAAARPHLRNVALINETAARLAGYTADSLGQPNSPFNSSTVIGIVADYHATSLFEPIMPLVLLHTTRVQDQVVVRLRRGQVAEGLTAVQAAWDAFVPDRPVQYTFLDQELDKMYRAEVRLGQLFGVFAAVAILLAGVGLLGLSAYVARRRAKEVSIRKVLGATAQQVIALLSREFVVLVAVAFGIGAPVAYLAMQRWLADFAYRIEVGAGLFVGVGAVVLLVTLLIVGSQAWRTARTDPAEVLRSE